MEEIILHVDDDQSRGRELRSLSRTTHRCLHSILGSLSRTVLGSAQSYIGEPYSSTRPSLAKLCYADRLPQAEIFAEWKVQKLGSWSRRHNSFTLSSVAPPRNHWSRAPSTRWRQNSPAGEPPLKSFVCTSTPMSSSPCPANNEGNFLTHVHSLTIGVIHLDEEFRT
jgi:hypothetical protein